MGAAAETERSRLRPREAEAAQAERQVERGARPYLPGRAPVA